MPTLRNIVLTPLLLSLAACGGGGGGGGTSVDTSQRGPYLQSLGSDRVTVCWRTEDGMTSAVQFGLGPGALVNEIAEEGLTENHAVTIEGLLSNTRYYYAVAPQSVSNPEHAAVHSFITSLGPSASSSDGAPLPRTRVWAIGDAGEDTAAAQRVLDAYASLPGFLDTDAWITMGDNAYPDGTDADYQVGFFDKYEDLLSEVCIWPSPGNHDYHTPNAGAFQSIFRLPTQGEAGGVPSGSELYYSFDRGNIHFVALDSAGSSSHAGSPMMTWLEADLSATQKDWIVAYWHHAPYTKGSHNSDTEGLIIKARERFNPVLEAHGVDLVLGGHSHAYERSYLIDGHYGKSSTFQASMLLDGGDGNPAGDGAYEKASGPHEGTVYVVAGSASKLYHSGSLDHPAHHIALRHYGSVVLDVVGLELDARFLNDDAVVLDHFRIVKDGGNTESAPGSDESPARWNAMTFNGSSNGGWHRGAQGAPTFSRTAFASGGRRRWRAEESSGGTRPAPGVRSAPRGPVVFTLPPWGSCPCVTLPIADLEAFLGWLDVAPGRTFRCLLGTGRLHVLGPDLLPVPEPPVDEGSDERRSDSPPTVR